MVIGTDLANVTTENLPSVVGGWFIVVIVTAIGSAVGGVIFSLINKELIPIGSLIGFGIGLILGLIIKAIIQL